MLTRTAALVAVLAAPAVFAQVHFSAPVNGPAPAVVGGPGGCGPRPAPVSNAGRWELRTSQQYVPGVPQQVWVEGRCVAHHRHPWKQRCEPGRYVTVQSPGQYQTVQQWVWVDFRQDEGRGRRFGRHVRFQW